MDRDLKKAKSLIPLVGDGTLTEGECRFIEDAARRYPELRLDLYRYERLHDLFETAKDVPAPQSIEDNVIAAIRSEGVVRRMIRVILFPVRRAPLEALGAAAVAILIFFAVLTYVPALMGTHKGATAFLDLEKPGSSTPSVPMTAPSSVGTIDDRKMGSGKDIALASAGIHEESEEDILPREVARESPAAPLFEMKSYRGVPTPKGTMTASGVVAEKASKVIGPARSVLPSTANKQESVALTTLIYFSAKEDATLGVLSIYDTDPVGAQKEIVEKALALGGTVKTKETGHGGEKGKTDAHEGFVKDESEGELIDLPPEKIGDFFDYLASRYPEMTDEIEELRSDPEDIFLRIDIVPTVQ